MAIILRIDVDNAYSYYKEPRLKIFGYSFLRICNYFNRNYYLPKLKKYHSENLKNLLEILKKKNVKASFFFKTETIPPKYLRKQMIKNNEEICLHATNTSAFDKFKKELRFIERKYNKKIKRKARWISSASAIPALSLGNNNKSIRGK